MPKTRWNGIKEEMDMLEEYAPGTKDLKTDVKQQLDRIDGKGTELKDIEE